MTEEIVRRALPEEEELAEKRVELSRLQLELSDRELYLVSLKAELSVFEGRYLREVGTLYAELDEWNAKIAEFIAKRDRTEESESTATQARSQATDSYAASHGETATTVKYLPSAELKSLFKQVAKAVHPDYASDEADRIKRESLMAAANTAFQRGDVEALRQILEDYGQSPESVKGTGLFADLARINRQIEQIRRTLQQIEAEVTSLVSSDIAKLMAKVETAHAGGCELLAEMGEEVTKRIAVARSKFVGLDS